MTVLDPVHHLSEQERERGLSLLIVEAAFSGGAAALTTGVILTAFALHLGASNVMIGIDTWRIEVVAARRIAGIFGLLLRSGADQLHDYVAWPWCGARKERG